MKNLIFDNLEPKKRSKIIEIVIYLIVIVTIGALLI